MAKTVFQNGTVVTPAFLNTMYVTGGGHVHDGGSEDGSASKIDLSNQVAGVLPPHNVDNGALLWQGTLTDPQGGVHGHPDICFVRSRIGLSNYYLVTLQLVGIGGVAANYPSDGIFTLSLSNDAGNPPLSDFMLDAGTTFSVAAYLVKEVAPNVDNHVAVVGDGFFLFPQRIFRLRLRTTETGWDLWECPGVSHQWVRHIP